MTEDELRKLIELADRRDAARQAWLRHLHLLAAGALTVLVGLQTGAHSSGTARLVLDLAWCLLAAAILLGGAALYGETAQETRRVKEFERTRRRSRPHRQSGEPAEPCAKPAAVPALAWVRATERAFVICLTAAVLCLAAFALLHR